MCYHTLTLSLKIIQAKRIFRIKIDPLDIVFSVTEKSKTKKNENKRKKDGVSIVTTLNNVARNARKIHPWIFLA